VGQDVCFGAVVTKVDTQFNPAYTDAVCLSDQSSLRSMSEFPAQYPLLDCPSHN
jgi:hypothetical protein